MLCRASIYLVLLLGVADGFVSPPTGARSCWGRGPAKDLGSSLAPRPRSSVAIMSTASSTMMTIPRSIKEGITSLRLALQQALRAKQSRMEVTLPRGVTLGVEAPTIDKGGDADEKADRELGRLFIEMFLPIEEATVLAFRDERQATKARGIWGDETKAKVTSFEELRSKGIGGKSKKKKSGFGATDQLPIPPGTEVFIAVAPSTSELAQVLRLSEVFGMDCALIVLNPRADQTAALDKKDQAAYLSSFTTVFHLTPCSVAEVQTDDNMLLYRAYPDDWVVAQKPSIGAPRILERKNDRFNREEVLGALRRGKEYNDLPMFEKLGKGLFGGK